MLAGDSLWGGKILFFPVFLPSQCKSEISWEEKDLVRKTTAEFRSDLLSRGGNNGKYISLQMQQILESPSLVLQLNCWQFFLSPSTTTGLSTHSNDDIRPSIRGSAIKHQLTQRGAWKFHFLGKMRSDGP